MEINKEFIPYEQALALKELGFDEPCFGKYLSFLQSDWKVYELILEMGMNEEFEDNRNIYLLEGACSSPTFSQAFRWFREKYGLEGLILPQSQGAVIDREPIYFIAIISYENELMKELFNSTNQEDLLHYNPREEAELECLKKLIEIVKNK